MNCTNPAIINPKEHIKTLLRWLINEVCSAGGDGDAIWIAKHINVSNILPIVIDINNEELDGRWKIDANESDIILHNDQECLIITNNKDYDVSSWSQCTLHW
jgi:hypothetical protein